MVMQLLSFCCDLFLVQFAAADSRRRNAEARIRSCASSASPVSIIVEYLLTMRITRYKIFNSDLSLLLLSTLLLLLFYT